MKKRLNVLAALVCLAGGSLLVASPAPAAQASQGSCFSVVGTYCSTPGARSTCTLGGYEEPIYCQSNHHWMYF